MSAWEQVFGRARGLTPRQALTLGGGLILGATLAAALALGSMAVAVASIGVLNVGILLAVVQLRRRLGQMAHQLHRQGRAAETVHAEIKRTRAHLAGEMASVVGTVDFAQRRIVGVLENERFAATKRHRQVTGAVEQHGESLTEQRDRLAAHGRDVKAHLEDQRGEAKRSLESWWRANARELEALLQLYKRVAPRAAMPPTGGWALDPTAILVLRQIIHDRRPGLILELGSGASSVWLGYALDELGCGRLVSIDHDSRFAGATRTDLEAHGLEHVAEVRHAPLVDVDLPDHQTPWYDPRQFEDLDEVDLLLVDGPPGAVGRASRYPALPVLAPRLASDAMVAIDDAHREDEGEIIERWREESPELRLRDGSLSSSLAVLARET